MSPEVLSLSEDLHPLAIWAVLGLCLVTCLLLAFETRRRSGLAVGVLISGIAGVLFLALAILRPTRVHTIGQEVPSRVLVLSDGSHRLTLPADDSKVTRLALRERALKELKSRLSGADVQVLEFGDGAPVAPAASSPVVVQSDLNRALVELSSSVGERPQDIFVLSDGRLSSPGPFGGESWTAEFKRASQESQGLCRRARFAAHQPQRCGG